MAEESTTQEAAQEVDQQGMASDYFRDYQLVDGDGNSVEDIEGVTTSKEGEEEEEDKQEGETQEEKEARETKEAEEKESKGEGKPAPKGFVAQFLTTGEGDERGLDTEATLGFLQPKDGPLTNKYPETVYAEEPKGKKEGEDEKPEWEQIVEQRTSARQDVEYALGLGLQEFQKAYQTNGGNADAAFATAKGLVQDVKLKELTRIDTDGEVAREKRSFEAGKNTANEEKAKTVALANEAHLVRDLAGGDEKKYQALMYGEGGPIIHFLFKLANPEMREGVTQKQFSAELTSWWRREVAANDYNLRFVKDLVLGKCAMQPELLQGLVSGAKQQRATKTKQGKKANITTTGRSGTRAGAESTSGLGETMEKYLHGDSESVPVIG